MEFCGCGRSIPNAAIGEIGDRGFCFYIAIIIEKIPKPHFSNFARHARADHIIEPIVRAWAGDLNPIEPVHFRKRHMILHPCHLGCDQLMHLCVAIAIVFYKIGGGFEIVRPLPAIDHSEMCAGLLQDRGQRCGFGWAPRRAVLMGQMKAKLVLIILDGVKGRQFLSGMAGETPWI